MQRTVLGIPEGMRDYLFGEAISIRLLESRIREVLREWGYREVITPMLEFFEVLTPGFEDPSGASVYKFVDRRGRIVALRPDMTLPVARLAASKLVEGPLPVRAYYCGQVFRYEDPERGVLHSFHQAGAEFIGPGGPEADAEVLALAAECLERAGVGEYRLGIGHAGFVDALVDWAGLEPRHGRKLRRLLARRDYVGYEKTVSGLPAREESVRLLLEVPGLHGGPEIIKRLQAEGINSAVRRVLRELEEVVSCLESLGSLERTYLDLGLGRTLDYYTGVIFEGYAPGSGRPVCGGGRYDGLLREFGWECPATGFAVNIDDLLSAVGAGHRAGAKEELDFLVVPEQGCEKLAYRKARCLREKGYSAEVGLSLEDMEEVARYASWRGVRRVLMVDSNGAFDHTAQLKDAVKGSSSPQRRGTGGRVGIFWGIH